MPLPERTLGDGLRVSAIGLGAMSLTSGFYGAGPERDVAEAVLRRAQDLGVTYVNTAGFYGGGSNEDLLGEVLGGDAPRVAIGTKFGVELVDGHPVPALSPADARHQVAASLRRLRRASLDVLILRGPLPAGTDLGALWRELSALVREGVVRHLGMSEVSPDHVRAAHAIHPVAVLEYEWSLFSRDVEADIVPLAKELGIGITAYSPLGRGLLAGAFSKPTDVAADDFRSFQQPRFQGDNLQQNLKLVRRLQELATRKGVTPGQLALAWLLHQTPLVVPIPGTKSIKHLEANLAAADIKLSDQELAHIEEAVPAGQVAGGRYNSSALAYKPVE